MSMHKIPLTEMERQGLKAHRLPIETPSQLADCFRQGVLWALSNPDLQGPPPRTYPTVPPDLLTARALVMAGLKSGDEGTARLAAQLAGVPACPRCEHITRHCKCPKNPNDGS